MRWFYDSLISGLRLLLSNETPLIGAQEHISCKMLSQLRMSDVRTHTQFEQITSDCLPRLVRDVIRSLYLQVFK